MVDKTIVLGAAEKRVFTKAIINSNTRVVVDETDDFD
jgi:hypothetical protein